MNLQIKAKLPLPLYREKKSLWHHLIEYVCMSINKNYFALLSVIYNLGSCKIAPIKSESDNLKECQLDQSISKLRLSQMKSSPMPVFVNKVLFEHSHANFYFYLHIVYDYLCAKTEELSSPRSWKYLLFVSTEKVYKSQFGISYLFLFHSSWFTNASN